MIVLRAPVDSPAAHSAGALDGFGDFWTNIELLFPQQRVGTAQGQFFVVDCDEFHAGDIQARFASRFGVNLRFRNSAIAAARSLPRSSCKKWRAWSKVTGPSACGSNSFKRSA